MDRAAVNGPEPHSGTLRAKLLAAFALVSTPPLVILAGAVIVLVDRAFDGALNDRLRQGLAAADGRLQALEQRAADEVKAVADTIADTRPTEDLGPRLAARRHPEALEVLENDTVLWSRHWEAGFGLPDRDKTYRGTSVRLETAAQDYGAAQRLTITSAQAGSWGTRRVLVRGGYFLDEAFWTELHGLMGLEAGLWDEGRRVFISRTGSPVRAWPPGRDYQALSKPLGDDLLLCVAAPRGEWDRLSARVTHVSLGLAAASLLAAVGFALALARRIGRPAGALAEAARRVAAGDLEAQAPVLGDDELAGLARAFNRMTSDLRSAQERLVQAERVAAWREIARRLAHELKNPIFPIALSMETVQRAFAGVPLPAHGGTDLTRLLRDSTQTTLDELRRLQRVVDEFSAFARMPQPQLRPIDLAPVVREVAALYQARAAGVRVEMSLDPTLPPVQGDPDLLIRALSNLVANALESMAEGGTLQLRTLVRDGQAVVEIEDNGPGITEEQKARLFTPYFTTKPGGTGLGLAIVQGIASDHGGRVEVRPAPQRGTIFALVLRLSEAAAA